MVVKKTGKIWHSPTNVYKHIHRLTKKVGSEAVEKHGKLKPVREARITAITALAMYRLTEKPAYIQLCKSDPPDAYILQKSTKIRGQLDISTVEITIYRDSHKETLLEQLKRTKVPADYHKYSDKYVLVVDLLTNSQVNFGKINEYLNNNHTPFPIWTFRALSLHPDTIGEMTILNPRLHQIKINFGEAAFRFKSLGLPEVIRIKWVNDPNLLKEDEPSGIYNNPPWDIAIEDILIKNL